MVQAGNDWKLWGALAGAATAGLVAWFVSRRRRRRTLRQRLAEELDLEILRESVQELRERLPVHDGEVARSFWRRRVRPAVQEAARSLPKQARRAQAVLEAERTAVEKLQREVLPTAEQAARQAIQKAEQALQRATTQAREVPTRLAGKRPRPARPGILARLGQAAQETAALSFWLGAAIALVYFGILRPEQREQLRRGVSSLVTQLRELWSDFSFSEEPLAEFTE
ncbi:hypothetical protein OO015_04155 [Thermomicrobium sp. 4228-Ro]|uniref:hypothetical protein n=1 Tax=Thermomicrobium sp. 4228-Ro TaxID=2993937 RepID=UPI0022489320|nr:hypothetical protein [Thermomicrobium sp. 4228-Ro]MCX2726685.1 hypothetical protein [Thermomicrobium sp. 4228-Ro]